MRSLCFPGIWVLQKSVVRSGNEIMNSLDQSRTLLPARRFLRTLHLPPTPAHQGRLDVTDMLTLRCKSLLKRNILLRN